MFSSGSSLCCIITGASRGYGRSIALSVAKTAEKSKTAVSFILVARSKEGLEETLKQVKEVNSSAKGHCVNGDLGELRTLPDLLDSMFDLAVTKSTYSHAILVNNAGSLGDVTRHLRDFSSLCAADIQNYTDLNITSPFLVMSRFLSSFPESKRYVVHISSLMAVQPYAGFALYCTGKAARDMLHQVVAKEEGDVRILNYAPGPLDTEMNDHLIANTCNTEIRNILTKDNILKPSQSSDKLVKILQEDTFTSGAHLDYFDY